MGRRLRGGECKGGCVDAWLVGWMGDCFFLLFLFLGFGGRRFLFIGKIPKLREVRTLYLITSLTELG